MSPTLPPDELMAEELKLHQTPEQFEELGNENGNTFWWQSDLQKLLGYADARSFNKAVGKAIQSLTSLGVSVTENVRHMRRTLEDGREVDDCRLTRFACYLVAMNASPQKAEVARAQAYFATLAEAAHQYMLETEAVDRVLTRDEITDQEKSLSSAAKASGVRLGREYALFQNAGYRGLYNMNLSQLKKLKDTPDKRTPLDFMGQEELAANLFRITQTTAKLRAEGVYGSAAASRTAEGVGRTVRKAIEDIGGTMPEQLPPSEDIRKVRSKLKKVGRQLGKIDKK